jgi:hypothetical protein
MLQIHAFVSAPHDRVHYRSHRFHWAQIGSEASIGSAPAPSLAVSVCLYTHTHTHTDVPSSLITLHDCICTHTNTPVCDHADDHKVCVLTRSATKAKSLFPGNDKLQHIYACSPPLDSTASHKHISIVAASTYPGVTIAEQGDWEACVRGSSAVVNLAGMPISTRWSPEVLCFVSSINTR